MGDENQRRAMAFMQRKQQIHNLLAIANVQIAGRLVGEQDLRTWRKRTRYRHTLLLAAGKLGRKMIEPVAEADRVEHFGGALSCVGAVQKFERQRDVLKCGHCRDKVERLKDNADMLTAGTGKAILVKSHEIAPGDADNAARGLLETGHNHQEGRLSRTARPDDSHGLAREDRQIDPAQNVDGPGLTVERKVNIFKVDDLFCHNRSAPG